MSDHSIVARRIALVVVLHAITVCSLLAQIKLDVKTDLGDKQDLKYVKAAAMCALNRSVSFRVVEFRERYSVWIHSCKESKTDSGLLIRFIVDLRTPAMFGKGKVLGQRQITYTMLEHANYSSLDTLGINADNVILKSFSGPMIEVANIAVKAGTAAATGGVSLIGNKLFDSCSGFLASLLEKLSTPNPNERRKAILAGIYIGMAVDQMVTEVER